MSAGTALKAAQRAAAQRVLAAGKQIVAGQPLPETHPELLAPGELQPGITAAEFAGRRQRLAAALPPAGLAVVHAAPVQYMAGVIPYPYRQDADFQYLTGITQPGVLAALRPDSHLTLFVPDRDRWRETWDGARLSRDAALEHFGADEAFPMSELPAKLGAMMAAASTVVFDADKAELRGGSGGAAAQVQALPAYRAAAARGRIKALRPQVHNLRWLKSPAELGLMRRSAAAAAEAMSECMRRSRPGVKEHDIAALFEYRCRAAGAQRMAYPPVVAGGVDATTVHYSRNDKLLPGGALLLLDGGCELHGYCSDVTRTWPVGGAFSGGQLAVYHAVLEVHTQLLAACRPGSTLRQLHALSVELLAGALRALGVLPGASVDAIVADQAYRAFYPHFVGHWLGMDTHDSSTVPHDSPLRPGVALTIEPGLYIPDDPAFGALRGVGVRLEDDVAVVAEGVEVLSAGVPLDPGEVEAMVGRRGPRAQPS